MVLEWFDSTHYFKIRTLTSWELYKPLTYCAVVVGRKTVSLFTYGVVIGLRKTILINF